MEKKKNNKRRILTRFNVLLLTTAAMSLSIGTISGYALKNNNLITAIDKIEDRLDPDDPNESAPTFTNGAAGTGESVVSAAADNTQTGSGNSGSTGDKAVSDSADTVVSSSESSEEESPRTPKYTPVTTEKKDKSSYFGGGSMTMLANHDSNAQNMSFIFETNDGMIVVDGGWSDNGESLMQEIKNRGSHVKAWLITHPHRDHAMALAYILNNHPDVLNIDGIYYSFFDRDWYAAHDQESLLVYDELMKGFAKLPAEKLHGDIKAGQVIDAGNAKIQVLNNPYKINANSGNNSSVCFTVSMNGTNVVLLGDLAVAAGNMMMEDVDLRSLHCDMVQMAHHGQEGVSFAFYQQLAPKVMLWPTPQWLWDNDNGGGPGSGNYHIDEAKRWQRGLLVNEYYVTKDGDQTLK